MMIMLLSANTLKALLGPYCTALACKRKTVLFVLKRGHQMPFPNFFLSWRANPVAIVAAYLLVHSAHLLLLLLLLILFVPSGSPSVGHTALLDSVSALFLITHFNFCHCMLSSNNNLSLLSFSDLWTPYCWLAGWVALWSFLPKM